ncbi:hypothetical protein Clacol_007754 [Clathrus columnatus]|uniref:Paired domain-containing protein n=1 Tax=Clathrus columnatus TaxID=1419009 RepID=A0AAV5AGM0_9AGAM|nr:hypothetical protein Clacol_007754 [Clathrus columnatus]
MSPVKIPQERVDSVIALLDSGATVREIVRRVGISHGSVTKIRKYYRPDLPKASGGRPQLLSSSDVRYAIHCIGSGKADTAVQVQKLIQALSNIQFATPKKGRFKGGGKEKETTPLSSS